MGNYKEQPRYNVVSLRVTDAERRTLQALAARKSLKLSDMMRQAMLVYTHKHEPQTV